MPGPVGAATSRRMTGQEITEAYHQGAEKSLQGKKVEAKGPTYKEEVEIERAKLPLSGSKELFSGGVAHALAEALEHTARGGVPAAAHIFLAYKEMIHGYLEAHENGKKRSDAMVRDAFTVNTLLLADDSALPKGFVAARRRELNPAGKTLDELRLTLPRKLTPEQMSSLKASITQHMREGFEWALGYDIRSRSALQTRLSSDKSFRDRFDQDIAFREGVMAGIWQAQTRPKEFDARQKVALLGGKAAVHHGR